MKLLGKQTEGGKVGGLDGVNLFFGALLGANLGTLDRMPIFEYVKLIVLLTGAVMTIRMVSTSKQRRRMLAMVVVYAALIGALLLIPGLKPEGVDPADLQRLVATLAVWIGSVLLIELSPTHPDEPTPLEDAGLVGRTHA